MARIWPGPRNGSFLKIKSFLQIKINWNDYNLSRSGPGRAAIWHIPRFRFSLFFGFATNAQEPVDIWNIDEKKALENLVSRLKNCEKHTDPEAIQTIVYSVGKENGYSENLREWFKAIYEIIFGDQDGPRMGFFISFFGIKETIELINKCIK